MKINAQISDLIHFASENGYPVHVNENDVIIDALGDGTFYLFWNDVYSKVFISRWLENKHSVINGVDEFKSLLYRRLHGEPEIEEVQPDIVPDVEEEDDYHDYL
ncbi:TPA: hypothetical protein ACGAD2_002198 [Salmonella enterica subsp. enterica serovar Newport]